MPLTITEEMAKQDPFYDLGYKKGKEEAKKEIAKNMYFELKMPIEQIAKVLKVSTEFVEEIIKEENKT